MQQKKNNLKMQKPKSHSLLKRKIRRILKIIKIQNHLKKIKNNQLKMQAKIIKSKEKTLARMLEKMLARKMLAKMLERMQAKKMLVKMQEKIKKMQARMLARMLGKIKKMGVKMLVKIKNS